MTNPFLLSEIEDQQPKPAADANPFSLGAIESDQRQDLRVTLGAAVRENPDQAARAAQLTKKYPVPVDALARNLMDVELQDAVNNADATLRTSPKLAQAVREKPWLAQQSHDDFPPLVSLEAQLNKRADRTALGTAGDVAVTALKGTIALPQAIVGLADLISGGYAGKGVEAAGIRFAEAQKILDSFYSPAQQQSNEAVKEAEGFVATLGAMLENPSTIATTVGESVPMMLGGAGFGRLLVSAAPKLAPWLAAAFGEGLIGAGATAEQIRSETDDGLLSAKQVFASTMSGAGTALFGVAGGAAARRLGLADIDTVLVARGVDEASAKALKDGFAGALIKAGISEGVFEEMPQSIQEQIWNNWATDKPLGQGVGKAAAQGLIAGLAAGGGFQAIALGAETVEQKLAEREGDIDRAQAEGQRLADALQAAAESKLRGRNPETFQQLIDTMSANEDGTRQSVFIDAQVLMQSATPEELAQLLPSTIEQLQEAATTNGTIEVPVSEALTNLPGTPLEQVFLQNARSAPDALSTAEATQAGEQAEQFLQQEADRVLQQAADTAAWQQSSETVRAKVLGDLNTAGRFSSDVNEAYATLQMNFFSTMAARIGITPSELYDRYSVKVASQGQGEGYNATRPGAITVEGYHYSKAARPVVSTGMFGTGLQGSNREQYLNAEDKRLRKRAYFYVDKGTGINPESGVGGVAQKAQLTNIYDGDADPLRLKKGGQLAFESAVLDAGFSGYLTRMEGTQSGQVILLGDQNVKTEAIGPAGRLRGQVVPAPQKRQSLGRDAIVDALQDNKALPAGSPTRAMWDRMLRDTMPEAHAALQEAGVFEGNQNDTLYKSDLIAAFEAVTEAPVYGQTNTLEINTPEFREWFGNSQVVDEQGAPLVVYHGTSAQFDSFTPGRAGGIYFSPNQELAKRYGENVVAAYLKADNLADLTDPNSDAYKLALKTFNEGGGFSHNEDAMEGRESPDFDPDIDTTWEMFDVLENGVGEALRAAGYDGIKMDEYGDEISYVVFDPTQVKSATDNRGTFDRNDPNFLNQSATIRRGTETLKKYGLKPGKSYKTREVAAALEARQRAKYGTIAADDRSPEALAKISKWMQAEVEFAMDNPESSGVGWYSEKFQRALDTMAQQFPELATDKTARNTMTALIAITSDGQKVVPNFAQAMDIYGNFKASGQFTTTRGTQRQASVDGNLAVVQRLHDQMGAEAMHTYLMQEKTISELKKLAKANGGDLKSDYQAHIKMPMAAVEFGPKLGAFYANLMGAHGYLTMDRWWSRTFNRYRGTLLQAPTRQGLDRFKELLGNPAMSDDEAIAATVEPRNAYEAKGFKQGTELEKAANTIYKAAFENLEDSPFNATDRTFMLDAVNKAQKSLKRKGYNLSVADIQAILWYYEKRLYGELGARQTADISYEEAAQRVVAGYASGSGIESLLDDTAAAPEDGGAGEVRVPVGEEVFNQGGVNGRLEQAGDRAGRATDAGSTPLPGAPVVAGATGPDPRLVAVAEQYARDNGIALKRQAEYVQVDPERAARIAQAYEEMAHAPNDPAVQEAYQNLIQQTLAQYRALEAAGYKFWFIDPTNDPYKSPFDAMREMRASQTMGVFPTVAGFGSGATDVDISDNPLMADTGIQWPYGSANGELKPVLANDLFRAVHDAFGHGLEGAGFRAQGEENAWQAHVRLFTGSAVAAITSETRGQNSWLNFGPYGETNRTAKVEDTVFADQKTGLMPEWTWTEGRVGDMEDGVYNQDAPLLAPNGKPSKLNRKLYAMVRTPEFKAWFGDWENDPTNASKAVDENGEPQVYYHGSKKAGFTEFDTDGKGKTKGTGAFFADSFSMARGYSGSNKDAPVYTPEQILEDPSLIDGLEVEEGILVEAVTSSRGDKTWEWYADEEAAMADLELDEGETLVTKPGYRVGKDGYEELVGDKDEVLSYLDTVRAEEPGVYEVFLNVRDMVTIDWQNNNWDDGPKEKVWNILDEDGDIYDTAYSQEEADAAIESNPNFTIEEDEQSQYDSTDDAAREGRDMGADGVLIKDVFDTGPEGYAEDGNVLIVYKPENIKEVRNQGTFDANDPNILKQGPRGTFSPSQLLITLNEGADLSTFLHESGHFFLEVMADLASQPDAPQQIKDDMATALKWFGVPDLATWNSYTLDQKRPYHERWAESFEQYLFEGKAPTTELQSLFRQFRSFMVNVYKSLTAFMQGRNLKVSDDVRQVFGRMLAVDEQIAQAEEASGMLPDFDATNEAIEKLQARSLRDLKWTVNARNKAIKALQTQAKALRKGIEAEVRAEVEQQPVYKAMHWLKKGETTDPTTGDLIKAEKGFRLDTAALAEMYPESMLARPDLAGLKGMTAKGGLHPDIVADMFGFESGDVLVRNILDAEPMASVIEGMTDQRMLERHGDLATPEAIADAANEAVHNEARAKSLATELKAQSEMMNVRQDTGRTATNGRSITVNAITAAAKQFAENLAARRRIKDLKSAAWQHRSAEARAGKRWQEATAKGETEAAVQAKRDQVLNNAAAKALQDAQVEAKKIVEFFKRVVKDSNEKTVEKGRDPDVVNAMRAILAAYNVAPRMEKSALAYMELVARNDPAMYAALKPSVDGAMLNAKPMLEMTMEELRGLNAELRAMWTLAKRSRQMEVDGNLLDIQDAADDLLARMNEIGVPDQIPGERGSITEAEERGIKLRFAKSILTRVEQWAEGMDGKFGGPFLRLVFQPVKDAADRYRTDKVAYRKKFTALLEGVAPYLPAGPIDAPELGYTFGNARDSGTAELLHAILHTGNDSNKRKLLLGRGWATENADGTLDTGRWDAFIERMQLQKRLAKEHYDFAQGVWDLLEESKPLAQETHRKVFGRYFAEVTANELVTPFGTYRGGYVPAQTDSRLVKDAKLRELAEGENESMAYAFPSAPSGFTQARVEYNQPLLLDLRALGQHMDKVLLFSHMQGAVTDVRRLLSRKDVSYALDRLDPGAYEGMLIPWLNRAAKQIVETPVAGDRKISRFMSAARSRAGMALMFANLSNTFQQITGFSMAAVKVRPGLMLAATAEFTRNPKAMQTQVAESSAYMKDRMLNEVGAMNDAVEQILIDPTLLEKGQAWTQRHAYFLQAAVDNTMSPIIWTAAYNQATEQKMAHKEAVRFADSVVRQTQGTTLPEDISRFESGPAVARLFTQFVGYFNMMANTNATAVKQIVGEVGLRKGAGKLLYVALTGLLVPIWVAEAIAHAFRGGPEDEDDDGYLDDWLMAVFGLGTIRGLAAQVPFIGQAGQLVINRFNDNPADDKFSLSPAVSLIESAVSAPASVYDAIVNDGKAQKAVRDVAALATMVTGLPIYGVQRPLGYLTGIADDKIEPTGAADLVRGLVTGTASPESKQQ